MKDEGENPVYCISCQKKFHGDDMSPPCGDCSRQLPRVWAANESYLEVHQLCFQARDGFSGNLDYGFLARMMDLMGLESEEQLEIVRKINHAESWLRKNQEAQGKKEKTDGQRITAGASGNR